MSVDLGLHLTQKNPRQLMRVKNFRLAQLAWEYVTGCGQGCPECPIRAYAVRVPAKCLADTLKIEAQLERRLNISAPYLHSNRRQAPLETDPPGGILLPSATRILTCWLGDLFAPAIAESWREDVLSVIRACASRSLPWKFLIRTCHPEALLHIDWPSNVELGIYIWRRQQLANVDDALKNLRRKYPTINRFLTVSPRAELLDFTSLNDCSWLYVGDYPANAVDPHDRPTLQQFTELSNQAKAEKCHLIPAPGLHFATPEEMPHD